MKDEVTRATKVPTMWMVIYGMGLLLLFPFASSFTGPDDLYDWHSDSDGLGGV